jgi:hypothetical protein
LLAGLRKLKRNLPRKNRNYSLQKTLSYIANNKKPIKLIKKNKKQQKTANANSEFKNEEIKEKIAVFSCSCGVKILIVPDLAEMRKAIENHVIEHKKLSGQNLTEDYLTHEILSAIIEAINGT